MHDLEYLMPGFQDEMSKEAFLPARVAQLGSKIVRSPALQRGLGGLGSGAGVGGLVGAAGGASVQGTRAYREAREMGATGGQALGAAVGRGIGGAAKGALIGAGLGGAGMGAAAARGLRTPALTKAPSLLGSSARFGQRQVHGLTGWTPKGGVSTIRGGSWAAAKRAGEAEKAMETAWKGKTPVGLLTRLRGGTGAQMETRTLQKAVKEHTKAGKGLEAARKAEKMGLTSLPGYARSMAKQPLKTVGAGVKEQWHSMGPMGRSLIFGLPAATAAKEMATPTKPGGKGKAERMGRSAGELAWGMGPLPISSMLLAAPMLAAAGGGAGKLLSKLRGKPKPHQPAPPSLEPAGGEAVAEDYVMSDRMTGLGGSAT